MSPQLEFGTPSEPGEAQRLGEIICQCFLPIEWQSFSNRIGIENFRLLYRDGRVVGGLGIYQMGQWFGGQSIPMAGLAAVGVSPEHRGAGVAVELLTHTLKELHANGVPLSALYPATQRLYRKVGYEQGGTLSRWEISPDSIHLKDRSLPMQPAIPIRQEVFHDLYRQQAKVTNGYLDRNQAIWKQAIAPLKGEVYAYLIGSEAQREGYIIFSQQQGDNESRIVISDWVVLTAAAGRCFWTFLADHRSNIKKVRWRSSLVDPLTSLLPEQTANIYSSER